jgi:copper chaperone CopZ
MASQTIKLPVSGMTCGNCAHIIERKLTATPGVSRAQVDLQAAIATVDFDPSRAKLPDLVSAIEQLGFQVRQ